MFILLPVGVNYQTERLPVVTFSLMGLNVAAYLAGLAYRLNGGEEAEMSLVEHFMLIPSESAWYAYVTSMFMHAGFWHLLGNMIYLFLFGSCVEDAMGRWKFSLFYLLGGLAAAFAHIAATPEHFASDIPLCGASGAVTTCIAGFLILFSKVEIEFRYILLFFFRIFSGEFSLAAWVVISFWFAKDLIFAALTMASETTGGGVAFAAHVGGFLAGLGLIAIHKLTQKKSGESGPVRELVHQPARAATQFNEPSPAEQNEAPTIFISENGTESGPFNAAQVRQMLALGSLSEDAFYWREGMTEWAGVQDFSS